FGAAGGFGSKMGEFMYHQRMVHDAQMTLAFGCCGCHGQAVFWDLVQNPSGKFQVPWESLDKIFNRCSCSSCVALACSLPNLRRRVNAPRLPDPTRSNCSAARASKVNLFLASSE